MNAAKKLFQDELFRVRLILVVMLFMFGLLSAALWKVQVARGEAYREDLKQQSIRRVRLPGMRGRVYDRNGYCLADNRPSYCISVYLEDLRKNGWSNIRSSVMELVDKISQEIGVPPSINKEDVDRHFRQTLPLPLVLWRDLDEESLARFSEQASSIPGVDIYVEAVRTYPLAETACHVLGYVGRADIRDEDRSLYNFFLREMAGRAGLEKYLDETMRGQAGGKLVRVDVTGYRYEDLGGQEPLKGKDLSLTLDVRVQKLLEKAIEGETGAGVIMDPRNGDILAMASYPTFNPNDFIPFISQDKWDRIRQDPDNPMFNRAIKGQYAPGSIFKPVVALAALKNNQANAATGFECNGYLELGKYRFKCWTRGRHGMLNMREAIERSCNVFFYRLGLAMGHEYIYHGTQALGLGRPTGIELLNESPGNLPNSQWMLQKFGHGWRKGDTCNFSIGQGALTVTPLQMARVVSAIANGGTLFRPRLVRGTRDFGAETFRAIPPVIDNRMNWSPEHLEIVRGGMYDVVMSEKYGTGKKARVPGIEMAGKTGTAEFGAKQEGRKHAWMVAFAPYDNPRYAIAIIVEEGLSGGVTVAPKMKQLVQGLFEGADPIRGEG